MYNNNSKGNKKIKIMKNENKIKSAVKPLSEVANKVIEVLSNPELNSNHGLTNHEIAKLAGIEKGAIQPGVLTGLVKRGLIEVVGSKDEPRIKHTAITLYAVVEGKLDPIEGGLTETGKPIVYNEKQLMVLNWLKANPEVATHFSVRQLNEALGNGNPKFIAPATITALVKRGHIVKLDEKADVKEEVMVEATVYDLVAHQ